MRAVSSSWLKALQGRGGRKVVLLQVDDGSRIVASNLTDDPSLASLFGAPLHVTGGNFVCDRTATTRRRVESLTLTAAGVDPNPFTSPLSVVSGNVVLLSVGFVYDTPMTDGPAPGQLVELNPLGRFDLADSELVDQPDAYTVTLSLFDKSRAYQRARFTRPHQVPAGTNVLVAAQNLLATVGVNTTGTLIVSGTTHTTPDLTYDEQSDPWTALADIVGSAGFEAFLDASGRLVLQPEPDPTDSSARASFVFDESVGTTLLGLSRATSNEKVYNGVIVTGETSSNVVPARAEVWDDDPTSPTYYLGKYGKVPYFFPNPLATTDDQAAAMGRSMLAKVRNLTELLTWTAVPNPALDEGDFVRVVRARSGVDALYMLDGFNIPLRANAKMACQARPRSV